MLASSPPLGPDSFHVRAPSQLRIPAARRWVTTTISKLRSLYSPIRTLAGVAPPSLGLATQGIALKLFMGYMTNISTLNNVNHKLSDVGRMVADTLDGFRYEQVVQSSRDCPRVLHHVRYELAHEGSKLVIDGFVIADNLCCCNGIHSRECIECPAKNICGHFAGDLDFSDIDSPRCAIHGNAAHSLRNLPGLVARAFEIGNALGGGHQESQVTSGRLSTSDDIANHFVDFYFHRIEPAFALEDPLDKRHIPRVQRLHRERNLRLHQPAHFEQPR